MRRPWQVWLLFAVCLSVLLAATSWISLKVLQLDRAETGVRAQAQFEETVRLALWRMESRLAPMIAQESARPYFAYSAFYPAERAYTRMFAEIGADEVRLPSPLLTGAAPFVLIHFQIDAAGRVSSPQAPTGAMRTLAESGYTTRERVQEAAVRLARLQPSLDARALWRLLPGETTTRPAITLARSAGAIEQSKRMATFEQAAGSKWSSTASCAICPDVREGMMQPMRFADRLVLARKVSVNGAEYVQGCELDWPLIRRTLLDDVADLLPQADLQLAESGQRSSRLLAALPVQLVPGAPAALAGAARSPQRMSLLLAWLCVLLAAGAVALLLRGTLALSERRAAFVSAVTHELRTPLTTLRMYAEMLAQGMLGSEQKRAEYLQTMRDEANRLAHLVENVLGFSRLERRRPGSNIVNMPMRDLLAQVLPRLEQRAAQADFALKTPKDTDAASMPRVDPAAVEQILFNLVDNACKYAASATPREIEISCAAADSSIMISVRDYGPGVNGRGRWLFHPFNKSARQAAESAPGIGLGLALSRRLARSMHGDLQVRDAQPGACFVLTLPATRST